MADSSTVADSKMFRIRSNRIAPVILFLCALVAIIIFVPSLTPAAGLSILSACLAALWMGRTFALNNGKSPFPVIQQYEDSRNREGDAEQDIVSLGKVFEATLSGMREGVVVIDHEMRVVASNLAARDVFSYSRGTPDAQRLSELTRNPAIYSAFLDALRGTERTGLKVETYGRERRIFDLRVVPLGTGNNGKEVRGAIGVFFDITQLERLERVRQEFLSNVSHELRTPLTAIIAFVETLEDGAIEDIENNRRFLGIIRKNAQRMHTLINDILELGAIEAGNVSVEPTRVPLNHVIKEVFTSLASKADSRDIELHNDVGVNVTVYADEHRLHQMLTNLIDNAIKFNRDGGTVTVSHSKGVHDQIFVADNGEGILTEHLARLFERFYRVDRARSRQMGGTGLGLAIVKHLARAHGGEVIVESVAGQGSTFTINLPCN